MSNAEVEDLQLVVLFKSSSKFLNYRNTMQMHDYLKSEQQTIVIFSCCCWQEKLKDYLPFHFNYSESGM